MQQKTSGKEKMHNIETEDLNTVFFEWFYLERSTTILTAESMVKANADHFKAHKEKKFQYSEERLNHFKAREDISMYEDSSNSDALKTNP
jgi:hypothetical protein